jgi:diguanylate cyclase (GGDEF)-like protein/PAS domain S-box-containing protein
VDRATTDGDLVAAEARYRLLLERSPVGQAISDLAGRLVEVNAAWADVLGYDREEVLGRRSIDFVHPDDREALIPQVEELLAGSISVVSGEHRLVRRDGSSQWVSSKVTLVRDDDGKPVEFHSLAVDITDLKEVSDALRRSENRYRAVVEALSEGILIYSLDGLEYASPGALEALGTTFEELRADRRPLDHGVVDEHGLPIPRRERPSMRALRTGRPVPRQTIGFTRAGESTRWFLISANPWFASGPDPSGVVVSFVEITARKQAEDALAASEDRFRKLAEELPVAVFQSDRRGELVYSNPRWHELIGRNHGRALAGPADSVIHPADADRVRTAMVAAARDRRPYHLQYRLRRPDRPGELVRWVSSRGAPLVDDDGALDGIVGFLEDITPLVTAQEETARLADIVESTSDLVTIIDLHTMRFSYINRAARLALDLPDDVDIASLALDDVHTAAATERFCTEVEPRLLSGRGWTGELDMRDAGGGVMRIWQTTTPALDAEGGIRWASSLGRDVTERRRMEAELAHRATHDPLTDLPNRTRLLEQLEVALERVGPEHYVAVLFLDLDRFKQVNDLYGHEIGDLLLAEVADRIGRVVRPTDTVARLGGDEFVILCERVDDEAQAVEVGTRITGAIERRPFQLGDVALAVTASVGIALSSGASAHSEELLRDADAAMYRAKDQGRARLELFDEDMRRRTASRLALTDELARAIERHQIEVHYQPCIDLATGRATAVEALARWHHPTRGLLAPKEFISLAEESGLIVSLGLAVLRTACRDARRWADLDGDRAPRVHVNLSTRQILSADLPGVIRRVLSETGLPAGLLCLEITESVLMDDTDTAMGVLTDLAAIGVQLAIDDFGTGYSSLSYLRRFPVDILKIDGSFVEALGPDPADTSFVGAIINLAHSLGLDAVAEGVETVDQLRLLRSLGCGSAQGYLLSPPKPAADVAGLLATTYPL